MKAKPKRHPLLTPGMARVLADLRALDKVGDIAEIVCDGLECWVGLRRTSWGTVGRLLQLCLLAEDDGGGAYHYTPHDEAYKMLDDPTYEPRIVEAIRTGRPVLR